MREEGKHGKNPHGVPGSNTNPLGRPGYPGSGSAGNPMNANQRYRVIYVRLIVKLVENICCNYSHIFLINLIMYSLKEWFIKRRKYGIWIARKS